MSGGYFDYWDSQADEQVEKLKSVLRFAKGRYSPETIKELRKGLKHLQLMKIYLHRIDWLLCDDDGEKEFLERLEEDLKKLGRETKVRSLRPACKYCKNYKSYKAQDSSAYECEAHRKSTFFTSYSDDNEAKKKHDEQIAAEKLFQKDASKCWFFEGIEENDDED